MFVVRERLLQWLPWILFPCLALGQDPSAPSTRPPDAILAQRVAELIRQLEAPDRGTRTAAEKRLRSLGNPVLLALPPLDQVTGANQRAVLTRLREDLERQAATDSVRPSLITLRGQFTLPDLLDEIQRQTRNQVAVEGFPPAVPVQQFSVNWQAIPFWNAIEELAQQIPASVTVTADPPGVLLRPQSSTPQIATTASDAFRIVWKTVHLRTILDDPQQQLLRVELELAIEPRLRGLFLLWTMSDCKLRTVDGQVLEVRNPKAQYDLPLGEGGKQVTCQLDFLAPQAWELDHLPQLQLAATMRMEVAARQEQIRFAPLAKSLGQTQRRGGVTVTLRDAEAQQNADSTRTLSTRLLIAYDTGGPAFESHRTWLLHNQVELRQGTKTWTPQSLLTDLQGGGVLSVTYEFREIPENPTDLELVYLAPTLLTTVPFHWKCTTSPTSTPSTP